ncbi:MAG: hypothetical protein AAF541_08470 [Pseudomonadota bacterium]
MRWWLLPAIFVAAFYVLTPLQALAQTEGVTNGQTDGQTDGQTQDQAGGSASSQALIHLAFGSFVRQENAVNWAGKLTALFGISLDVELIQDGSRVLHRVISAPLPDHQLRNLMTRVRLEGIEYWRVIRSPVEEIVIPAQDEVARESNAGTTREIERIIPATPVAISGTATDAMTHAGASGRFEFDWELGLQNRLFAQSGVAEQSQAEASLSLEFELYYGWDDEASSITFNPFFRYDTQDHRRSHADVRELYYTLVGSNWDLHVGAKRVFWGVTEFHHLIDIINQTDLVENIDGEDKLGQPMVHGSVVGEWGLLDAYILTGFRERTFPGENGRLRHPLRISSQATYESGAGDKHVDWALRWSHSLGPVEFGLHHFSGTSRDPTFNLVPVNDLEDKLVPHYFQIEQSGLDAQAILGNWILKFEGLHREGFGPSYYAANAGVERTFYSLGNSAADVGLVLEYLYDDRGDNAFNTLFENDLVIGGRFALNNYADTQMLVGLITDLDTDELIFSIEGSHRIGQDWLFSLEGRGFAGGESYRDSLLIPSLTQREFKSSWLGREDYIQLELTRFF